MLSLIALGLPLIAFAAEQDAPIVRAGDHFRLHCHVENQALADEALLAVESVWDAAHELYDLRPNEGETLFDVHLHRTIEQYEAVEQELTKGAFKSNLSFSHIATKSSHVVLLPFLSDAALEHVGLPLLTRNLLVHEAAHLVTYQYWPDPVRVPNWIAEGSACHVEELALNAVKTKLAPEEIPYFSTSMSLAKGLLESKRLPSVQAIMADDLAELTTAQRYAIQRLFVRYLATSNHRKSLTMIYNACRMTGGGPGFTERIIEVVEGTWSKSKLKALNKSFQSYINKLDPHWNQIFRSLDPFDKSWIQGTPSNKNAIAWFHADGSKKYTLEGDLSIFEGDQKQMNLLLGRNDAGFIQVCFGAGEGITILELDASTGSWKNHGYAASDKLIVGQAFHFTIDVKGSGIDVSVDGASVLSVDIPDRTLAGQWGLGALRGSSGLWKIKAAPGY